MRINWKKLSNTTRLVAVLILLAVVGVGVYQLYDYYRDKIGVTPTKTITAYFEALGQGNYAEVYRLTATDTLSDIYGRPITRDEFIHQLESVMGDREMPFTTVETFKLVEKQDSYYYVVKLHSAVGGTDRFSRLVVEVKRAGNQWVVVYPFAIVL
jgi:hypothetical protein